MRRTTPIEDRKTVGYVFGGSKAERMQSVLELKQTCYMVLSSPTKRLSILNFIENEQSDNGIIKSLYGRGYVKFIR